MKVAIVGAGAAGCFCAVHLKRMLPEAEVAVYERGRRPLAKVAITGGGRCNITNTFRDIIDLRQAYPRGARLMRSVLARFSPEDTWRWWEEEGVPLVAQDDQCVFPRSQEAMQVVGTLTRLMQQLGVRLHLGTPVTDITALTATHDRVVVTTGGSPRPSGLSFLAPLGLHTEPPVPSLFALNVGNSGLHALTGAVTDDASVSLPGTKFRASGPLLITHFGMSGPAILRLSSYAARHLAERDYRVSLSVNWMQGRNEEEVRAALADFQKSNKQVIGHHPAHLTARHWAYLAERAGISPTLRWSAMNRKELNRLVATLTTDTYPTLSRCHYKGEFVTCGGVSLSELDTKTLSLKRHPQVYMAGEVLDVDAITGGFNLQAAWSMGYVVAQSIAAL